MTNKPSLSYRDAGVDIDAGNALVDAIKPIAKRTSRPEVMGGLGGFGSLCRIPAKYKNPVLVSGTDGVGTKLRLALQHDRHDNIGIDLVAMCVNDLIVGGAEPLFFLDYYATGKLDVATATRVVSGIGKGCELSGCALVGGETAEMPGMYQGNDYDLAGFCVGVVEESDIIDGSKVKAGDIIIGLASSGPHSNGFSLIRRILEQASSTDVTVDGQPLIDALMTPTQLYVKPILSLLEKLPVHAMAHITGGGLPENLPRVLPSDMAAHIDTSSWQWPEVFQWLQNEGSVQTEEMYRTFNCGVGMALVVDPTNVANTLEHFNTLGIKAWQLGSIQSKADKQVVFA